MPGDHPFYFDEIQATSGLIDGHFIYGVFTTPDNSISGSAICGFSIKDISKRLDSISYDDAIKFRDEDRACPFLKTSGIDGLACIRKVGNLEFYYLINPVKPRE